MTPTDRDRWSRAEELFAEARELSSDRRRRFLEEQCAGDRELQVEVASLLDTSDRAGGFLEEPIDPRVGSRIDRWRVLGRIGAGGMGIVYLARRDDGAYEQVAALKILKHGGDRPDLLDRFRLERQILAGLLHPNIARLIDGGTTSDGAPWFVMEHVEGDRLDHWCDERRLPLERRLELFRDVCAAVHCAHQNLVIHRDLKPSNILVTGEGVAKLVDFGISKLLAPSAGEAATRTPRAAREATRTIERRLTPEYASPEVVRGAALTTGSDVFSLGVVLYELLTGTRPWRLQDSTPTALERAICETTPPRPSACEITEEAAAARGLDVKSLRHALRGDLDAIVMTALAPEPQRRYGSAAALSADLERHQRHEPILARPPGAAYLLAKFVRRHRALVAAGVVALLALAAGAAGLVTGTLRAHRQMESTARVNQLMREMLVQLEPTSARGFSQSLLKQIQFAEAELERGLLKDDPLTEVDLRIALGRVHGALGYAGWAHIEFKKAYELAERVTAEDDPRRVQLLRWLGWAERNSNQLAAAEKALRAAISLSEQIGGVDEDRCAAQTELGLTLTQRGRFDEADAVLRAALAARAHAADANSAGIQTALALNLLARGNAKEAEAPARASLELCEKLFPEADPRFAMSLDTLARVLQAQSRLDEAEPLLERSLEIRRQLFDPQSPVIAWSIVLLADVEAAAGRPAEAVPLLEEALAIREKAYPRDSQPWVETKLQLGLVLIDAGEKEEGTKHLFEAIGVAEQHRIRSAIADPMLARAREEIARAARSASE